MAQVAGQDAELLVEEVDDPGNLRPAETEPGVAVGDQNFAFHEFGPMGSAVFACS